MPELPEVETLKIQLEKEIIGLKITGIAIKDKRLIKRVSPNNFKKLLENKTVKEVSRKGKVLILKISKGLFLVAHLRISGWLIISDKEEKFSRVVLKFHNGKLLNFCDQRVLGELKVTDNFYNLPIIKTMGPCPLDLKKEDFFNLFKNKKTKIKPLLMDQKFLAGVGNLYAQESLFLAGVDPERPADKISKEELGKIYRWLTYILRQSIEKKGSSLDNYRQLNGSSGGYVLFLKVYQRKGKPCLKCETEIKRKTVGGRGTYFCPKCQS